MNNEIISYIEQNLRAFFDKLKGKYPRKLYKAMEYAVFSGGKRIRPYLMLLTADFLGLPREKVINQAVSLELIHSYSLVHDDLPGMDNDDFRRGQPTCHKEYGEALAILAGDALLNAAFENLFDAAIKDPPILKSCRFIAFKAGGEGMIGGQALEFSDLVVDLSLYEEICSKKTGALISAAVMCPALIRADMDEFEALKTYGDKLGLIFQFVDDLLDLGKDKLSFATLAGKDYMLRRVEQLKRDALETLSQFGTRAEKLAEFCNFLTKRTT
ncbi:MAG TPA: polyprenyl synthetase family protein [Clostridia bacterium]|nr:polyprenyl synthetase family protein [Clostridia bacterium]